MSDIRDVLQHRATSLSLSLRSADQFNASVAKASVKRKRAVRAAFVSTAAAVGIVVVGTGAWAGYSALNPTPLASPSASESPSHTPSASPSVTPSPSATPSSSVERGRLTSATDAERLEIAANPRTSETWTALEAYDTTLDVVDTASMVLVKVGEHDGADIVAVAPRKYDIYSGGRPIAALLEFDDAGVRAIACPMPVVGELCSHLESVHFGADVSVDEATFYDTLVLPSEVQARGGVTVSIGTDSPLGDASGWDQFVTSDPDYNPVPWANAVDDTAIGQTQSTLVRAYDEATVQSLDAFDYAIRTPFGSYMRLLEDGIGGMDAEGFAWDDGAPVSLFDADVCAKWGDGACPKRWLSAEERCFPLSVTEDPAHREADWVASGTTSDGRVAYLPKPGGNDVARDIFTTMRDSSWDPETNTKHYAFKTYARFLDARSVITFKLDDGRWVVALAGPARNNPYECA